MKIYCDYCGSQFDTEQYRTCPHCGGTYSKDKEILEEKAKLDKADELFMEQKALENERMRLENNRLETTQTNNAGSQGCLIGIIAIGAIGTIFFILMILAMMDDAWNTTEKKVYSTEYPASVTTRITQPESPEAPDIPKITISMDPIKIPEIPEINIPDISIN